MNRSILPTRRTQIDDAQREMTINFVFQSMLDAPNNSKALVWMVLKELIGRRSAAQVTRMEQARGLAARS